jgi:hypothetical protein
MRRAPVSRQRPGTNKVAPAAIISVAEDNFKKARIARGCETTKWKQKSFGIAPTGITYLHALEIIAK